MDKIFVAMKDVTVDYETATILCPVFFKTEDEADKYIRERIEDIQKHFLEEAKWKVYNNGRSLRTDCYGSFDWYYEFTVMEVYDVETTRGEWYE